MPDSKALREKRAELVPRMRELADRANDDKQEWRPEDKEAWEAINADYNDQTHQIEEAERVDQVNDRLAAIEAEQVAPGNDPRVGRDDITREIAGQRGGGPATAEDRALGFQAWLRAGDPTLDLTEQHQAACQRLGFNPYRRGLSLSLLDTDLILRAARAFRMGSCAGAEERALRALERRDLSAVTGASGGFTIPTDFVRNLEINMLAFGGMLQVSDILRTATGNPIEWPTADDTSNTGEQLGEAASVGSSVDPTFAQIVFYAYKFSSKLVKVPSELLQDSAFAMSSVVGAMLGERLGRITNTRATTGTGAGTMRGIVTAATLGVTAAAVDAIAFDEIRELEHSIDAAYRPGAGFMCEDATVLHLRQLKDGESRYLWDSSTVEGQPDKLDGFPMTINEDMATIATSAKTLLFGQLSKYKIRQVAQMRMLRLDERYADNDQVAFIAFIRQDGNLLDAGTAPVKYLQQA